MLFKKLKLRLLAGVLLAGVVASGVSGANAQQGGVQAASNPNLIPPVPVLDPNATIYPRSSLHDFSDLVEAPAGKRGFVESRNGHFYYQDGTRARFWGINVANTSLQESEADIAAMIQNFRAAGFNLVRLHHFDERGGIIDLAAPDSRRFLPERLKKLDYWIYKAKEAGLYVYLDLLDYRRFKEGDGVPNAEAIGRAARPYNVFDPRLIELQKEYAKMLLSDHVNEYTGLSYAQDPAVVMLEIYDESGLFMKRGVWREMPEPYATNFKKLWNDWLRQRYKNTQTLLHAWADEKGVSALTEGESLERGNIELPVMTWTPNQVPENQRIYSMLPRRNDGAVFAYHIHREYFRDMKQYLRGIGVRIPVSVTGRFDDVADLKSITDELDFVGTNFYYDHPYWGTGKPAWQPPSYFHNQDPLTDIDDRSMAAQMALARVKGSPLVVREWNYCWPNENRAAGIIEAASYAALHDLDAMILFVYETRPTARVSYFNVRSDPARWGLCGIGAAIFLKYLVSPSKHRIVVPYNAVDTFTYTRYHQPMYALGWTMRMENAFYDKVYRGNPETDLLMMPGRSGYGRLEGAPAILQTSNRTRDLTNRSAATAEYLSEYKLEARPGVDLALAYNGTLYPPGRQVQRKLDFSLSVKRIEEAGYKPIGVNRQWGVANGFIDNKNKRLVFSNLQGEDTVRAALDALRLFHGVNGSHLAHEQNVFASDTGQLRRDSGNGRLTISTPRVQVLAGNLNGVSRTAVQGLQVQNLKYGTIAALALDGKSLVESKHFVVKMVTGARNADDVAERDPRFIKQANGQSHITVLGRGPVLTDGKNSAVPVTVTVGNRPLLDVYLSGGGFELVVKGDDWQFYCDTPGTRFAVREGLQGGGAQRATLASRGATQNAPLQQVMVDGKTSSLAVVQQPGKLTAQFPRGAAFVRSASR